MKYLNLGCGTQYSAKAEWTNLDFVSHSSDVIEHNLLGGIPFPDSSFDVVYHSHVLEHFSEDEGRFFLKECVRVLKPDGVLRLAVPDLEKIAKEYLKILERGLENPRDQDLRANYNWIMLELYDQSTRNISGGKMAPFILDPDLKNEEYVFSRIGEEGRKIRYPNNSKNLANNFEKKVTFCEKVKLFMRIKLRELSMRALKVNERMIQIGRFRSQGEIHQWMYDRYSLSSLFREIGLREIMVRDAFTSSVFEWKDFNLDGKDGVVRKPDSLFMEAIK